MKFLRAVLLCALAASADHAKTKIKLGTVAPVGSAWHQLLVEMGQKWAEASGGTVELKIYAGGSLGNEGDLVRKMNIGQLQAAAITTIGMHEITPEPQAVDVPLMLTDRTADARVQLAGTLRSVDVSRDDGTIAEVSKN